MAQNHILSILYILSFISLTTTTEKLKKFCTNDASDTEYGIDIGETFIKTHKTSQKGSQKSTLLFTIIGDYGAIGDDVEIRKSNFNTPYVIGEALNDFTDKAEDSNTPMQFVINVGDNFYDTGVRSVSDKRWDETFNEPLQYIPKYVYSVLGNHDYFGNSNGNNKDDVGTTAQIDFTTSEYNTAKNWCMPNYFYTFSYNVNNEFKIRFIAIDTTPLIGYVYEGCLPNEDGDINDWCFGDSVPTKQQHLKWFKKLLKKSKSYDYVVVFGHHFLVSRSEDGLNLKKPIYNSDTGKDSCMEGDDFFGGIVEMREIANIIAQYDNVQLYISGHGHVTEAFEGYRKRMPDSSTIIQPLIGRQGRINDIICGDQRNINEQYNSRKDSDMIWTVGYGSREAAFGAVYVTKNKLRMQILDQQQNILWSKSIPKSKHKH